MPNWRAAQATLWRGLVLRALLEPARVPVGGVDRRGNDPLQMGLFWVRRRLAGGFGSAVLVIQASALCEYRGRDRLEPPDEAGPRKALQQVVRDVDFPPEKAVPGRALITAVVVVPALAKRDDCEDKAVA